MNNLYQINKKLTFTIFFFSLTCLFFVNLEFENSFLILICFFFIATIGVSHGALDHLKGYKVLKIYKIKNKSLFYISYLFICLIVVIVWVAYPTITLILFLLIASYHFGKEDSSFDKFQKRKFINLYLFFKGSLIILAPLWINPAETIKIFDLLDVQFFILDENIILLLIGLSVLSNVLINRNTSIGIIDSFSIIMLNLTFMPLVAFTIYFCFLHSIRHTFSLIKELNNINFYKGFEEFIKNAFPLTLITAILFLISIYFLSNYYILSEAILKVIFIGLASLTFPHILLEYIIEKNEK